MSSKRRKSAPNKLCSSPDSSPDRKLNTETGLLWQYSLDNDFNQSVEDDADIEDAELTSQVSLTELELSADCEQTVSEQMQQQNHLMNDQLKTLKHLIGSYKLTYLSELIKSNQNETSLTEQVNETTILRAKKRLNQIIEQLDKLKQRFMQRKMFDCQVSH